METMQNVWQVAARLDFTETANKERGGGEQGKSASNLRSRS